MKKMDPTHQALFEDGIISWTWNTFIESNGSDPDILLYLPMTKVNEFELMSYENMNLIFLL
jgi:hypothetical protein